MGTMYAAAQRNLRHNAGTQSSNGSYPGTGVGGWENGAGRRLQSTRGRTVLLGTNGVTTYLTYLDVDHKTHVADDG